MSDVAIFFTSSPLPISFPLYIPHQHFSNQTGQVSYFVDTIEAPDNVTLGVIKQCFLQTPCDQSACPETPRRGEFHACFYLHTIGFWRLVLAGDVTFRRSHLLDMTPAHFLHGAQGSPWQSAGPDQARHPNFVLQCGQMDPILS